MKKIFIILISTLISLPSFVFAQSNEDFTFRNFGFENGLTNSYSVDIERDKHGNIWLATESGLFLFDGVSFQEFNSLNTCLPYKCLNDLLYDEKRDELWIASKEGLCYMNCATLEMVNFQLDIEYNNIQTLCEDGEDAIWASNRIGDIQKIDLNSKTYIPLDNELSDSLPNSCISLCYHDGYLYVGHITEGLSRVDIKSGEIVRYCNEGGKPDVIAGNRVYSIFFDHHNNLWIGTGYGLSLFNPIDNSFFNFRSDSKADGLISDHIYSIAEPLPDQLWISTDVGGISIVDLRQIQFGGIDEIRFKNLAATYNEQGLSSNNVRTICPDPYGNIWIAMHSSGLDCMSRKSNRMRIVPFFENSSTKKYKAVRGLCSEGQDTLWMGCENEIAMVVKGEVKEVINLEKYLTYAKVMVFSLLTTDQYIYIGLYDNGLLQMDRKTYAISKIDIGEDVDVNALFEGPDKELYVGTRYGVRLVRNSKLMSESRFNRLCSTSIYGFLNDSYGNLWIGNYGTGIFITNKDGNLSLTIDKSNFLANNIVHNLMKASDGSIWVATQNGLEKILFDGENFVTRIYTEKDGLDNTFIHAVEEDGEGNIWFSTDKGISCLDPKTDEVDNYSVLDGTPVGNFNDGSSTKLGNGSLCFGSQNGLVIFDPTILKSKEFCSKIAISSFLQNENEVSVKFHILDFSQLSQAEYSYCIPEIDNDWNSLGNLSELTFRNLSHGNHTLKIRARLRNQEWNEDNVVSQHFYIQPSIWIRWYAWLLYALLLLLIISYVFFYYRRRVILHSKYLIEKRNIENERALNKERLQFYTNITHELRTPLTLIVGPLEDIKDNADIPAKYRSKLGVMYNNGKHLLELITQLLDFRKTETDNRVLVVQNFSLSTLVYEIGVQFQELNINKKLNINIEVPDRDTTILGDQSVISSILNNLLSNAVKYTQKGEVKLKLQWNDSAADPYALISVSDTGCGIAASELPHIFERFYRAKGSDEVLGTGIGLSFAKSLADLHRCILKAESIEGQGSTFSLAISIDNTYPNARHVDSEHVATDVAREEDASSVQIILVVEDNPDIRSYIESSLSDDFKVLTAENGVQGLKKAQESIPDIIISDIMMPEMNGLELCNRVKGDILTSHIPVILLTAKDTIDDQSAGYVAGADSYLTKPFSAKLLRTRIQNILKLRQQLALRFVNNKQPPVCAVEDDSLGKIKLNPLDQKLMDKFIKVVLDNIDNVELSMVDIEDNMAMSHSTLYRKIKAITGMSGNDYMKKIRLDRAKELLEDGSMNVTEVAYSTGFSYPSYFIAEFKKEFGYTPGKKS